MKKYQRAVLARIDLPVVFLDLETTGTDSSKDSIIEIGGIRLEKGKIKKRFSRLVNPGCSIPEQITRLTGIRNEDVRLAPTLEELLPELKKFLNGALIFAHNARFEESFLRKHFEIPPWHSFVDTCVLAAIVLPLEKYYNLESLSRKFGIRESEEHRALADSTDTLALVANLISLLIESGPSFLRRLKEIFAPVEGGLGIFFKAFLEEECRPEKTREVEKEQLSFMMEPFPEVENFFEGLADPYGTEGVRKRIEECLARKVSAALEAGETVGRIVAVIYQALRFGYEKKRKILYLAADREKLLAIKEKVLPVIASKLPVRRIISSIHSPASYICLRCLAQDPLDELEGEERAVIKAYLESWSRKTEDGNLDGLSAFMLSRFTSLSNIVDRIRFEPENCLTEECPAGQSCFFRKAMNEAADAFLVLGSVSEILSAEELFAGIIFKAQSLIVDDAHRLEDAATEAFRIELRRRELEVPWQGVLSEETAAGLQARTTERYLRTVRELVERKLRSADEPARIILSEDTSFFQELLYRLLDSAINVRRLDRIMKLSASHESHGIQSFIFRKIVRLAKTLENLVDYLQANQPAWIEHDTERKDWAIITCPADVGEIVWHNLAKKFENIILISSTLLLGGHSSYFMRICGLERLGTSLEIASIPLFKRPSVELHLIVPGEMPAFSVQNLSRFKTKFNDLLVKLARSRFSRIMVIYNSIDRMKESAQYLVRHLRGEKNIICQHVDGGKARLLKRLEREGAGILLGCQAFMDYSAFEPGEIDALVLEKIPFPHKDDPLINARREIIVQAGLDEFYDYVLPAAIIRLRQAINRLLAGGGKKILVVADPKILSTGYSEELLSVIPAVAIYRSLEEYLEFERKKSH